MCHQYKRPSGCFKRLWFVKAATDLWYPWFSHHHVHPPPKQEWSCCLSDVQAGHMSSEAALKLLPFCWFKAHPYQSRLRGTKTSLSLSQRTSKIHSFQISESIFSVCSHLFFHLLSVWCLISLVEHANINIILQKCWQMCVLSVGAEIRRCCWHPEIVPGASMNPSCLWPSEAAGAAFPPCVFICWKDSPQGRDKAGGSWRWDLAAFLTAFQSILSIQEEMLHSKWIPLRCWWRKTPLPPALVHNSTIHYWGFFVIFLNSDLILDHFAVGFWGFSSSFRWT